MATYDVFFYESDPYFVFSRTNGGFANYTGPADETGFASITDDAGSGGDLTFEGGVEGETATADITLNGTTLTGVNVFASESWTLRDTVTNETFEIVTFAFDPGTGIQYYTLSEVPLVAGRSYETVTYDATPDAESGDPVFTYADYEGPDGIVEGTSGDDVIDGSYAGDPEGDVVDGNDGPGGDTLPLEFNWTDYTDEASVGGATQNTGGIQVDVSYSGPAGGNFTAELSGGTIPTESVYVGAGEPFNPNSAARLFSDGSVQDSTVTFDFSAVAGSGLEGSVENVEFRISDIDGVVNAGNNFQDIITILAYDADGNAVPVTITVSGDDSLNSAGDTVTGTLINDSPNIANGSILVEIAGPVSQIVVTYDNGGDTQQAVYFSDLHYDASYAGSNDDVIQAGAGNDIVDGQAGDDELYGEAGDDTLTGGQGADLLDGGTGDDTLNVGSGDTALGGDGDDLFLIDAGALGGAAITITGGEGDETLGDTLDFNGQLLAGSVSVTNSDDANGGYSGTATLLDGTVVTFTNIESIICYVSGTEIQTPHGPRAIEDLKPGDLVLTRDAGPQPILWHGARSVMAEARFAPIEFAPGTVGNDDILRVSPQHRMLIRDHRAQLYFGESEVLVPAKSLVNGTSVREASGGIVTYHHLMFAEHQIITAAGAPSESYHPGGYSLAGLTDQARAELLAIRPGLGADPASYGPAARCAPRPSAARVFAA